MGYGIKTNNVANSNLTHDETNILVAPKSLDGHIELLAQLLNIGLSAAFGYSQGASKIFSKQTFIAPTISSVITYYKKKDVLKSIISSIISFGAYGSAAILKTEGISGGK